MTVSNPIDFLFWVYLEWVRYFIWISIIYEEFVPSINQAKKLWLWHISNCIKFVEWPQNEMLLEDHFYIAVSMTIFVSTFWMILWTLFQFSFDSFTYINCETISYNLDSSHLVTPAVVYQYMYSSSKKECEGCFWQDSNLLHPDSEACTIPLDHSASQSFQSMFAVTSKCWQPF